MQTYAKLVPVTRVEAHSIASYILLLWSIHTFGSWLKFSLYSNLGRLPNSFLPYCWITLGEASRGAHVGDGGRGFAHNALNNKDSLHTFLSSRFRKVCPLPQLFKWARITLPDTPRAQNLSTVPMGGELARKKGV